MSWKEKLFDMDSKPFRSMNHIIDQDQETKNDDVGLVNPVNGSGIVVRDNKRIEAFSDLGLGFRMDPDTQTLSFFAPNVQFFCNSNKTYDYEKATSYLKGEYKDMLDLIERGEVDDES